MFDVLGDTVLNLTIAGRDTTSSAPTHPDVEEKIRDELGFGGRKGGVGGAEAVSGV